MHFYIGDLLFEYVSYPSSTSLPTSPVSVTLDLRSGAQKSSDVPPKRPYRKKMVVHSPPPKRDEVVHAEVVAEAGGGAAAGEEVPPSVRNAARPGATQGAMSNSALLGDLLQQDDAADVTTVHDFGLWEDNRPPARNPVTDDAKINDEADPKIEDADRISVASLPGTQPPPPSGNLPPLNPFTPEWFA